ncbi:MAG: hypothetical protein FWE37_07510 [Spirochaetaceae bacterium]|nr:hypothetical protein [Spirochaetaceae bacterium]
MYKYFLLITLILFSTNLLAQEALPNGYRNIVLGSSMEEVREALANDTFFLYRGRPDASMLFEDSTAIEVRGAGFIHRAFFLFYNDRLYNITLELNPNMLDFFTIYQTFVANYGEPTDLSPSRALWSNDEIEITIERELFVKYIDVAIFNELRESSNIQDNLQNMIRDNFLSYF